MNKWYFLPGVVLLTAAVSGTAQQTISESAPVKIIVIEEKIDSDGKKIVTKSVREGDFTDAQIDEIIAQESQPAIPQGPKGYLGVMIENAENGVRITEVLEGSPAASAGLVKGDIITSVDGQVTPNMESLVAAVSGKKPGETAQIHYSRNGEAATVQALLTKREEPEVSDVFGWDEHIEQMKEHEEEMKQHEEEMKQHELEMQRHEHEMQAHEEMMRAGREENKPRFGVTIDDVDAGPGVVVTSVYEGSVAEEAGIEEGDVITSFNKLAIQSPDDLIDAVRLAPADKKVQVVYIRGGKRVKEKVKV